MSKNHKIYVTVVTNRGYSYIPNIVNNFIRQSYPFKKLIIIINRSDVTKKEYINRINLNQITNYDIEILPDKSLGMCLNYAISKIPEDYNIWCKMDDDDYYGKHYLLTNLEAMLSSKADIVGRGDMYVYVHEWKKLFLKINGGNKIFKRWVQGASLFVKKYVFNKILFSNISIGEDVNFGESASKIGFKIFTAPINDYIVVRHIDSNKHTWKRDMVSYLKYSKPVNIKIFKDYNNHIF